MKILRDIFITVVMFFKFDINAVQKLKFANITNHEGKSDQVHNCRLDYKHSYNVLLYNVH